MSLDQGAARAVSTPTTRVGLVGLGTIGQVHLRVLSVTPGAGVIFTVDPERDGTPATVPHFRTLGEALHDNGQAPRSERVDLIVIATPTDTHLDLALQALRNSTALVLSEKPLSHDPEELERFLALPEEQTDRIRVVDHFGFAPEVHWAAGYVGSRGWGPPRSVLSSFNDPYLRMAPAQQRSYVSAWVDSGSNQLAILSRFVDDWTVELHSSDVAGTRSITEVSFSGGSARLLANWATGASSKQTVLRWDESRELLLDHTAMTGAAFDGGRLQEHFGNDAALDRKTAHYRSLYTALLGDLDHPLLILSRATRIARALAVMPDGQDLPVRWVTSDLGS